MAWGGAAGHTTLTGRKGEAGPQFHPFRYPWPELWEAPRIPAGPGENRDHHPPAFVSPKPKLKGLLCGFFPRPAGRDFIFAGAVPAEVCSIARPYLFLGTTKVILLLGLRPAPGAEGCSPAGSMGLSRPGIMDCPWPMGIGSGYFPGLGHDHSARRACNNWALGGHKAGGQPKARLRPHDKTNLSGPNPGFGAAVGRLGEIGCGASFSKGAGNKGLGEGRVGGGGGGRAAFTTCHRNLPCDLAGEPIPGRRGPCCRGLTAWAGAGAHATTDGSLEKGGRPAIAGSVGRGRGKKDGGAPFGPDSARGCSITGGLMVAGDRATIWPGHFGGPPADSIFQGGQEDRRSLFSARLGRAGARTAIPRAQLGAACFWKRRACPQQMTEAWEGFFLGGFRGFLGRFSCTGAGRVF